MNQLELERAAEERLFDAALGEVLASMPARPAVPAQPWFAAAILLLGTGVLLATALLAPHPDAAAPPRPQQPELPPPMRVEGRAALAAVDRSAQNLSCLLQPSDLPLLAEFTQLRRLLLEETSDPIGLFLRNRSHAAWSLAPLAACTHLRSLGIGNLHDFAPQQLAAVAQLPELRELELIGTNHVIDAACVDVLQKLPLRSLSLQTVRFDPAGFAALCQLPLIEHLELRDCLHLDRCDLTQLQQLRQLHSLSLRGVGGRVAGSPSDPHPLAAGDGMILLTAPVMRAIATLPRLRELDLATSPLDDDTLAALPAQLTALHVSACTGLGTKGLMAAPPLPQLTELGCSMPTVVRQDLHLDDFDSSMNGETTAVQGAQATLWQFLRAHHLRKLRFLGQLPPATRQELARQTLLRELDLVLAGDTSRVDLDFTAAMPELERLSIAFAQDFDPTPLTQLRHLRRVAVRGLGAPARARLVRALGDSVQVLDLDR